jgi:hypothetical protein
MTIDYSFAGVQFSQYGVYVAKSEGLLGNPSRKKPEIYEYPGETGHVADLASITYEPRTIKLSCLIKTGTLDTLLSQYNSFTMSLSGQNSLKNLILSVDGQTKRTFSAYVNEISELSKQFREGMNFGTFTITFIEPQPQ